MQIQHFIQSEGLGPDDFLGREEDLAAEFGVSRPTLREALKLLASGNLIRATKGPGGGIFVAHTADQGMSRSLSDAITMMLETETVTLEELLDARVLLEVPLAGLAAYRPEEATLERLRDAIAAEHAADPEDTDAIARADVEIHMTIATAAGNRMIQALTGWVFEVLQPRLIDVLHPAHRDERPAHAQAAVAQVDLLGLDVEAPAPVAQVVDQHEALLAAIDKGDPARAERAMKDHLLYLRDVLRMVQAQDGGGGRG